MDYMDPDIHCAKKVIKLNYSLTYCENTTYYEIKQSLVGHTTDHHNIIANTALENDFIKISQATMS